MTGRLLISVVLFAGLSSATPTYAEGGRVVRVLPIGDSHTVGVGSSHNAGYRLAFVKQMSDAGFEVDMVGGQASGPEGLDHRHQGQGGATTYEVSSAIHEKMAKYEPDLVVLLVGTNDARDGKFSPYAFEVNLSVLLDRIFASSPDVKLVLATIPPQMYGKNDPANRALNDRIRAHVAKRSNQESIRVVDVYNMVDDRLDMSDPVHMNDAGYEKVGAAFAAAAQELLRTDVAESR
jgi:lysophospholipase L1-like esterase